MVGNVKELIDRIDTATSEVEMLAKLSPSLYAICF